MFGEIFPEYSEDNKRRINFLRFIAKNIMHSMFDYKLQNCSPNKFEYRVNQTSFCNFKTGGICSNTSELKCSDYYKKILLFYSDL
jgi:hypothetical protein